MAIKKGNVRLQVTVSEAALRDLDELRGLLGEKWSRSAAVEHAIWCQLIDERQEAIRRRKEEQEGEQS